MTPIEVKIDLPTDSSYAFIAYDLNASELISETNLFDQITDAAEDPVKHRPLVMTIRIEEKQ